MLPTAADRIKRAATVAPKPGNPYVNAVQDSFISIKARGNYPELPEGWGRTSDGPVILPIQNESNPGPELDRLKQQLLDKAKAFKAKAKDDGFRGLDDLKG